MILGKVLGSVWATHKEAGMEHVKLLIIQPVDWRNEPDGSSVIAADRIGAGVGEKVIVSRGNPARVLFNERIVPVDAVVVGIVDGYEVQMAGVGAASVGSEGVDRRV